MPRLFVSPSQYVQGPGAIQRLGECIADLAGPGVRAGVLVTPGRRRALFAAVAQGLTVCADLHRNFLHGELGAVGVMAQLLTPGECI